MRAHKVAKIVIELDIEEANEFILHIRNPKFDGDGLLRALKDEIEKAQYERML